MNCSRLGGAPLFKMSNSSDMRSGIGICNVPEENMKEIVIGMPFNEKGKPKTLAIGIKKYIAVFSPLDHIDGVIPKQYRM